MPHQKSGPALSSAVKAASRPKKIKDVDTMQSQSGGQEKRPVGGRLSLFFFC